MADDGFKMPGVSFSEATERLRSAISLTGLLPEALTGAAMEVESKIEQIHAVMVPGTFNPDDTMKIALLWHGSIGHSDSMIEVLDDMNDWVCAGLPLDNYRYKGQKSAQVFSTLRNCVDNVTFEQADEFADLCFQTFEPLATALAIARLATAQPLND